MQPPDMHVEDWNAELERLSFEDCILSGVVRSWTEQDEAVRAAWVAPGVVAVENRISVVPVALTREG